MLLLMCLKEGRNLEVALSGRGQMTYLEEGFAQGNWRVEKSNYKMTFLKDGFQKLCQQFKSTLH